VVQLNPEPRTDRFRIKYLSNTSLSGKAQTVKLEIPQDIINKTTRCINGFTCLYGGWEPCGSVKGLIDGKILSLDVDDQMSARSCDYRVPFGGGMFCTCPTGVEVFKLFGSTTTK